MGESYIPSASVSYEDKIRKVFKYAYIQREKNTYGGPIWYKYAVFTGPNKYCRDSLLGLGNSEEKAWLDAFYGFKFLKVHLGIEKKPEVLTVKSLTMENADASIAEESTKNAAEDPVDNVESGYQDNAPVDETEIEVSSEGCILILCLDKVFFLCLEKAEKIQCEGFIKDPRDRRKWIQCTSYSNVKVIVDSHVGEIEMCLCRSCYNISNDGVTEITVIEEFGIV